jgi:bifunctional UDP-N-acetylglucosamine pyrophosphorylase/glucosamine-1-phosphate N-acetyltransferase
MHGKLAVVILAAGRSTRFKSSLTKTLHRLCGKPMIEYVFDAALGLEPAQVIVVYGAHSEAVTSSYAAGYRGTRVDFVLQDPPLGTGHALLQAEGVLADGIDSLLVMAADTPLLTTDDLLPLFSARSEGRPHAVLTGTTDNPHGYGRVQRDELDGNVVARIIEEADATESERQIGEVNSGIYLFDRGVFDHLRQAAVEVGKSAVKGEYYLPDVVQIALTAAATAPDFEALNGVNDRAALCDADALLQRRIKQRWMREGVTFILPETTYITSDVELAPDIEVGPQCMLTGATTVKSGTRLVQGCALDDTEVGEDCTLTHVRAQLAVLHRGVTAGPWVNLRPGTVLHVGVKVGNFVETKKADVGAGSKLPHLQYVGDATIGEGVNIGAGTIFCNYDGFNKHHITIGEGVFVGSNSSLQAPLTIGDGAFVAMGSAVTHDVPPGALAVGRSHQVNKEGYAHAIRERHRALKAAGQPQSTSTPEAADTEIEPGGTA